MAAPLVAGDAVDLPTVRRFEAAGFRAWPASSVLYDGTWAVRLTASLPAKRLNSVNPLDPFDRGDLGPRIARLAGRFEAYGRPLTFRLSPLAGPELTRHFDAEGWSLYDESLVMRADLAEMRLDDALTQIPVRDVGRFVRAAMSIAGAEPARRAGLTEVIESIVPDVGLFVVEDEGCAVATGICVHDGDLASLFEIMTDASRRGRGHGRRLVLSALRWARLSGARQAWLQVGADNEAALALYRSLGFGELYRYHYRSPADG